MDGSEEGDVSLGGRADEVVFGVVLLHIVALDLPALRIDVVHLCILFQQRLELARQEQKKTSPGTNVQWLCEGCKHRAIGQGRSGCV